MLAMEALSRQRNDDISLLNQYLDEMYARLDRDLPLSGARGIDDMSKLWTEVSNLSFKLDAVEGVQLREVEARLLREVKLCAGDALACRSGLERLETSVQRALEQLAQSDMRLKTLTDRLERVAT